ncbi:restriction endonuclease subunit S [Bifidobacterium longum subsp. longum]|nr:restriction endonuclease subunit S [Bifidobacterium longum]MDM7824537.1 restriction endonuclease subunit S [Bifidobacterium longum subsp. longum]
MMTEQAKVPAIRFAGFTDPWEQRKLGELALTYSGGTPSAGNSAYYGGEIPFIRSAEIDCDSTELSLTVAGLNNSSAKLVDKGMVLYAMYGATSGEVAISKIKGAINQAILAMDASDMAANRFIAYWLRRQKKSITETFLQGGQGNLSGAIIKELGIPQPSLDEQRQIGSFFSNLDDLITLHQRKYDKLVIFKKSMLEKMFPKDGESVPEIRFAGFTDPWEQRKLENLASFGGGHTPSMADASNYVDGKILWVTSQDVKQHYIENTTTMISEKGAATLTLYPSDSIVIVARSGILRHTIPVAKLRKPATVNQDIKVIQTVDSCDSSWLLQYFIASNKTLLREYGKTGTTVESIDFAKMKSTALMVPYIEEQQAIGSFFSRLDNLITLHQRKLELLQNIKKSLLDKMFV